MKIYINNEVLINSLTKVIGVIERRQTLPILSNVFFNLSDGILKLTGTDLEVQISSVCNVDTTESIKATLPGRKLIDICRSLEKDSEITMNFKEDKVLLQAGKSRFTLRVLAADEFPLFDEQQYLSQLSLDKTVLHKAFHKTTFCMAQQDIRYYLNGLMLEIKQGNIQTVASDGHRLALFHTDLKNQDISMSQAIIPRKAAQEILKLLDSTESDIDIKIAKNHINFLIGNVELNAKLIDGRFPDFKNVIPDQSPHSFTIDKQAFKAALSRVSILSNEKYRGIRLDLNENLISISANNPERDEAEEAVTVDYSGENISMGFNSSYLMEALSAIESDEVCVSFTDTNSSCLLEDINDSSSQFVIMPMRL